MIDLTLDQQRAFDEIIKAREPGHRHLLTGYAGTGKTTLMQRVAAEFQARGKTVALTAPTHKAVSVLARKVREAGLAVDCLTIHSLLSLQPETRGDRQEFVRRKGAPPVNVDVVVIDECSMLGADLMAHIRRYLPMSFVLFVGDPAQLPPVGEIASQAFDTKSRSHLDTIVRQAEGNPILAAAHAIRAQQGSAVDWSWVRPDRASLAGVFVPGNADTWLQRAFTSEAFEADPDRFRYLAWTNAKVADVNAKVRRWRYGEVTTPFVPGERAMLRAPVIRQKTILFATNEEAEVVEIAADVLRYPFEHCGADGWIADLPSWRMTLRKDDGTDHEVHMVRDDRAMDQIDRRLRDEAAEDRSRWQHRQEFRSSLAVAQAIYALTVHNSQGSTFGAAFVDLQDIRRRKDNLLEMQQLLYVAATRPTTQLVLVGAP